MNPSQVHRHRGLTALLLLILIAVTGCAKGPTALVAYVASAGNNHVQVIDLESGKTLRKIYTGATPWRLVPSPDRSRLLVQHWYSGTTAVVDLADHEVRRVLPYRGPGIYTPNGDQFLTFSWPVSALYRLDAETFEEKSEEFTEVSRVYDLDLDPEQEVLYLLQADPMAGRAHRIYSYIVAYPYAKELSVEAAPVSLPTGYGPSDVRRLATEPFVLTADGDTNGLSLINANRDGRAVPSCPAPRVVLVSPDEKRMIVSCWRGEGQPTSQVAAYTADFAARPWPELMQDPPVTFDGALTAGFYSPRGDRVYLADRSGARLLELDPGSLEVMREFPTGAEPAAVLVLEIPVEARDRLAAGESEGRRIALEALARLREAQGSFTDLKWTETAVWFEPDPEAVAEAEKRAEEEAKKAADADAETGVEGEASEADTAASEEPGGSVEPEELPMIERSRVLRYALRGSGELRTEAEDGGVRLAQAGHTVSLRPDGRFWVTPRQELISVLYSLPNLSLEEGLRRLAGDEPGAPFLSIGIAVDVAQEVTVEGDRYWVLGAPAEGARASQLWIDVATGRPVNLVEQIPVFRAPRHGSDDFSGIVETRFVGFTEVGGGVLVPTQLERVIDGHSSMAVTLEDVEVDSGLAEELFSAARLGGFSPDGLFREASRKPSPDGPGESVPVLAAEDLESYSSERVPYNSSPPTSGPRLYDFADWGVHEVPVPPELQVQNLEQGGVAVQYNCAEPCPDLVARLREILRGRNDVLLAPYPWMKARIALSAWGRLETLEEPDAERIRAFLDAYLGRGKPEGNGKSPSGGE